jgi:hypothetical protein
MSAALRVTVRTEDREGVLLPEARTRVEMAYGGPVGKWEYVEQLADGSHLWAANLEKLPECPGADR